MTVVFTPLEDHAVVQLEGPLTQAQALELRDVFREAGDYWKYSDLTLELNSPGGELLALRALMYELKCWRARGRNLKTVSLGFTASAAAIALSLGNLGQRAVQPHSVLLYHHSRLMPPASELTAQHAANAATQLHMADRLLLDQLVAHICEGLGGAQALAEEGLARCEHLIAHGQSIANEMWPTAGGCCKPDRGNKFRAPSQLKQLMRAYENVQRKGVVTPFAELLATEFERDQPMPLDLAWAMLLIDEVQSVALMKPMQRIASSPSSEKLRLAA